MDELTNFEMASNLIRAELVALVKHMKPTDVEGFLDGRNRDQWMDAFIDRLRKRYQQPGRIASND